MKASINSTCVLCSVREMISTGSSLPGASRQQFDDIWTCKAYLQNLKRYHCSEVWPWMSVYAYPQNRASVNPDTVMNLAALGWAVMSQQSI
jgi:hypothetical protein